MSTTFGKKQISISLDYFHIIRMPEVGTDLWRSFGSNPQSSGTSWSQLPRTVPRHFLNISKNDHFWVSRSAPAILLCICYWRGRLYTSMHNASLKTHKWTQELWCELLSSCICIFPIPQSIILHWCATSQSHSSASLPQPLKRKWSLADSAPWTSSVPNHRNASMGD